MKKVLVVVVSIALVLVSCLVAYGKGSGRVRYIFTALPGERAVDINDQGIVIMQSRGSENCGTVWIPQSANNTKGTPYDLGYELYDINNSGDIVGISGNPFGSDNTSPTKSFKIKAGQPISSATILAKAGNTAPLAINNKGIIVGRIYTGGGTYKGCTIPDTSYAMMWTSKSKYVNIGKLHENLASCGANGINDNGTIIGYANEYAWVTTSKGMFNLGCGKVCAINNKNVVVGQYERRGCKWTNSKPIFLDNQLPSRKFKNGAYDQSIANSINDRNQAVGQAIYTRIVPGMDFPRPIPEAVIWQNSKRIKLQKLVKLPKGWVSLTEAKAINNKGQIIGYGERTPVKLPNHKSTTEEQAFLLTPVGR